MTASADTGPAEPRSILQEEGSRSGFVLAILCVLYLISTFNYLLFHGIVELAGVAVAFSIFIIVWNSRRTCTDAFILIVGISFLFIGVIDLVHTLAYKGMGVFPGYDANLPTQLWIAARYFQSIFFLAGTLCIGRTITRERRYDTALVIAACAAFTVFLFASIFLWNIFPDCFTEGSGLTPFKIYSEYTITFILIAAIIVLYRRRGQCDPKVWQYIIAAQVFQIFGELAFTSYANVYGFMNMLGHLSCFVAVCLLYRAFIVDRLEEPRDRLESALMTITASEEEIRAHYDELAQMQTALAENEHHLKRSQEVAHLGSWELHLAENRLVWSDEVYRIFGQKPQEFKPTYEAFLRFVHPDDRAAVDAVYQNSVKEGKDTYDIEHRIVRGDTGEIRIVREKCDHIRNGSGRIVSSVGIVHDITELREKDKALHEIETQMRTIIDSLPNVMIYTVRLSPEGVRKFTFVSGAIRELHGCSADEAMADAGRIYETILEEEQQDLFAHETKTASELENFQRVIRLKTGDGTPRWVYAASRPRPRLPDGSVIYDGVELDVTNIKMAEEAIARMNGTLAGQARRLSILNRIISTANRALTLQELLASVLDDTLSLLEFDAGGIYLIDPDRMTATVACSRNLPPQFLEETGRVSVNSPRYEGLFLRGEPIITDHYEKIAPERAEITGILSVASIPILDPAGVIGSLNVISRQRHIVTSGEQETLISIGRELAGTIRKLTAEEGLRESERRLREAQQMAHLGFWSWDVKTGTVEWSDEVFRVFGVDPGTFTPRIDSILARSPWPEEQERGRELIRKATESHEPGSYEQRFLRPDGSTGYYYSTFQGRYDTGGNLVSIVGTVLDISGRKAAEDKIRENEKKYRELFENITAGFALHEIITDGAGQPVDYRFLIVNEAFEKITGLSGTDITGRTVLDVLPDTEPAWIKLYGDVALSGKSQLFENYSRELDKWFEVRVYCPKKGQFATVINDITARRMMEDQRETLIRELGQKNAELERFTFTVSHDLKSPLITIKGFTGMIEEDIKAGDIDQIRKDLYRITDAAEIMQGLLSDLLELSRVGKVVNPPVKTAFGTIAHEAVELLAGPLAERGVRVEIAPNLPVVNVDHARIREVLVNLIENSIKFSGLRRDPLIQIGADMTAPLPVFFVRDNGIGINPRYLGRIFNLFERLETAVPGTGIGLPINRRIIEVHGGKIWAESGGEGTGTTFYFTLP